MLGWLFTSNLPTAEQGALSHAGKLGESSCSASSTLKPTPLSSTASLTHPSAELTEMFTLEAPECLAMLLQHS